MLCGFKKNAVCVAKKFSGLNSYVIQAYKYNKNKILMFG